MELAIIGDTHVPSRASGIPDWVRERVEAADHTIHTGDFETPEALRTVRSLADGSLTAVRGNVDPASIDLPAVATVDRGGVTVVVTHGTGDRMGYEDRVASTVRDHAGPDAVGVAGHTHDPRDTVHDGVRLLNPGSATGASPATQTTMLTATVDDGDLDVALHRD
ncbi:metallophosphoesterase family protein [Haloplanus halobius]|uniref:metallophosphoesterase family protein n=1 Tax=Haloplanus halobius TaxID=2934938 RepID=UPI00200CA3EF|nr:metallophosphoesterase family protein [Haloplanus sp. XH21]